MKKSNFGQICYTVGLLLLVIQLLILLFNYINGSMPFSNDEPIVFVEEITFSGVISTCWSGIAGTVLLVALFVRRIMKGSDGMLTLVGSVLWFVQLISLYDVSYSLRRFALNYILGIVGVVFVTVVGFVDFLKTRNNT